METAKALSSTNDLDERINEVKTNIAMLTVASSVSALTTIWWILVHLPTFLAGQARFEDALAPSGFVILVAILMHTRLRFTELMFEKLGLDK